MKKWKQRICILLGGLLAFSQISFTAYADAPGDPVVQEEISGETVIPAEEEEPAAGEKPEAEEETEAAEEIIEILEEEDFLSGEEAEIMLISEDGVINPGMTQEEINAAMESAEETILVEAGDYGDLDLKADGKNVRLLSGSETTKFRFVQIKSASLILENDLSVNAQNTIVDSDKSAFDLVNGSIIGNGKKLSVSCQNSGNNKPSAYAMSVKGDKAELEGLQLTISGSNGDRGLLNINSKSFKAADSNLQVCGNGGLNAWGSTGTPNICIGHDAVCETREILFENCIVNASGSKNPYGDGMQINKTADPCTITFKSCTVNLDNNGGNGFMGNPSGGEQTKKVVFIDSDVSACGNGQGKKGASIGFANAAITLINNGEKGSHELKVSDNYKLGIASNNLAACTSINAQGYKITASRNGVKADGISGYGMYLGRSGSSFKDCILTAEENGMDGITLGGDTAIPVISCEVRTVLNGGNGLKADAPTEWSDVKLLSSCNGAVKGDHVDTTAAKPLSFINCSGSIGRADLNEASQADGASSVLALSENGCKAVTEGEELYILKQDGTVEKTTKGALSHHAMDWENSELVSEPTDTEYGCIKVVCSVCGKDTEKIPLVRVVYDKNTEDTVTEMPADSTDLPYGTALQIAGKPVRRNYTFTGWYLDKEAAEKASAEIEGVKPTTRVYAGWAKKVVTPGGNPDPTPTPTPTPPPAPTPTPDPGVPPTGGDPQPDPTGLEEVPDSVIPLAAGDRLIEDEDTPLAQGILPGTAETWALVNFALMNLAVFESLMLLIGYFIKPKNDEEEEEKEEAEKQKKLKKKGIARVISIPVAVISVIAFLLTEDISRQTGFVDRYTLLMAGIAAIQTVVVAFSRKKYETEEEAEIENKEEE